MAIGCVLALLLCCCCVFGCLVRRKSHLCSSVGTYGIDQGSNGVFSLFNAVMSAYYHASIHCLALLQNSCTIFVTWFTMVASFLMVLHFFHLGLILTNTSWRCLQGWRKRQKRQRQQTELQQNLASHKVNPFFDTTGNLTTTSSSRGDDFEVIRVPPGQPQPIQETLFPDATGYMPPVFTVSSTLDCIRKLIWSIHSVRS